MPTSTKNEHHILRSLREHSVYGFATRIAADQEMLVSVVEVTCLLQHVGQKGHTPHQPMKSPDILNSPPINSVLVNNLS